VKHSLSPSVKAGGYGTAGWAVGGDVIIDVHKLVEIDIEIPKADGSFTSLCDVAPAGSKGKHTVQSGGGQRRREEDANLRHYDSASQAVASFLDGSSFPDTEITPGTHLSPLITPSSAFGSASEFSQLSCNLNNASSQFSYPDPLLRPHSLWSGSGSTSSDPAFGPISTALPVVDSDRPGRHSPQEIYSPGAASADPFGYLNHPSNFPPASEPLFIPPHYSQRSGIWTNSPVTGNSFGQMTVPFPAQAEPIHPFCYVTFGAGMRQKEIDTYTANHKLEAKYLMGSGDGISYHVPL
jgi:hypothetical protein